MYASEVIESLTARYHPNYGNSRIDFIQSYIRKAQKFHFGQIEKLPGPDVPYIWGLCKKYWQLPYQVCWFDYRMFGEETGATFKIGYLALKGSENHNEIMLSVFVGRDKIWYWVATTSLRPIAGDDPPFELGWGELPWMRDTAKDDYEWHATELLKILLLLNCKNIKREKIFPPKRLQKKRAKSKKIELFSYHVLRLQLSKSDRGEGHDDSGMDKRRLHLCRGHFREYTPERPLFGKISGLVFVPAHVRGRKHGVVMKDYEVS